MDDRARGWKASWWSPRDLESDQGSVLSGSGLFVFLLFCLPFPDAETNPVYISPHLLIKPFHLKPLPCTGISGLGSLPDLQVPLSEHRYLTTLNLTTQEFNNPFFERSFTQGTRSLGLVAGD